MRDGVCEEEMDEDCDAESVREGLLEGVRVPVTLAVAEVLAEDDAEAVTDWVALGDDDDVCVVVAVRERVRD